MKIAYDYQIFSSQRFGGVSRYFFEIANRIHAMHGADVIIFSPLYVNEYFKQGSNVRLIGIKISSKPLLIRIANAINNRLQYLISRLYRRVDIFHETYYSRESHCPAGAKKVITVYDMIHERFPVFFSSDADRLFIETKENAIRRADHIICISQSTRKDLMKIYDIPEAKISVVHLGSSLATFDSLEPKINTSSLPYILYVGHRAGYKNFENLLLAYAGSSVLKKMFDLVCFGGDDFSVHELKMIETLKIPNTKIRRLTGDDNALANSYTAASLFVYPSLYEGFGIPPLEAMALGCPVACSNTSSMPEVVGDCAALFDPESVSSICDAITRIALSPGYAEKLRKNGKARSATFSWDKCASNTLAVYRRVLDS